MREIEKLTINYGETQQMANMKIKYKINELVEAMNAVIAVMPKKAKSELDDDEASNE